MKDGRMPVVDGRDFRPRCSARLVGCHSLEATDGGMIGATVNYPSAYTDGDDELSLRPPSSPLPLPLPLFAVNTHITSLLISPFTSTNGGP